VAHFPSSGQAAHTTDDVVARPSLRFVDDHESRKHASQYMEAKGAKLPSAPVRLVPQRS
jgi:hypothetical protein